jgi:hypothetical protein
MARAGSNTNGVEASFSAGIGVRWRGLQVSRFDRGIRFLAKRRDVFEGTSRQTTATLRTPQRPLE